MDRTIPEISLLRRKQLLWKLFQRNEYFVLENAYYIIRDTNYSPVTNISDIVSSYSSVWYKTDMDCFWDAVNIRIADLQEILGEENVKYK